MLWLDKNWRSKLTLFLALIFASCSHQLPSSRDITAAEEMSIANAYSENSRLPADWGEACFAAARNLFKPKVTNGEAEVLTNSVKSLPELTQLSPEIKQFPNGRKYILYQANADVMKKYPDYDEFLEQTAEIIFEPSEPFGHIRLRVGKTVYSFNNIQSTSANGFSPRMIKSTNPEMPSSHGFVFQIGKDKIAAMKNEVDALYKSSASNNIPAFDAYSPMLKIVETEEAMGKTLKYETTSPKYGNSKGVKGKIVEEAGQFMLDAENGVKVPVVKKGNEFFTQSYSCSSSAGLVLNKFFGINISNDYSAKSLAQSLLKGNINEKISPTAVIKYYED